MQRLSQQDPRWKNQAFGVPSSRLTIGGYGCTITAIANLTENLNPVNVARLADFVPDANLVWASISKLPNCNFLWRQWDNNYSVIVDRFRRGEKAIIKIFLSNGLAHWLSLIDVQGDTLICIDPNNPAINTNISRSQVAGSAFFSYTPLTKPNPTPPAPSNQELYTFRNSLGLTRAIWRSDVIQEIINAGIWQGTWQQNADTFNRLNPSTPQGGYRAGNVVRIADPKPVDNIKQVEPIKAQPEPVLNTADPIMPQIEAENKTTVEQINLENELEIEKLRKENEEYREQVTKLLSTEEVATKENTEAETGETFSFNKLVTGVIAGKNPLANSAFFLTIVSAYTFYTENQQEITLALNLLGQGIAILYPLIRKFLENSKKV